MGRPSSGGLAVASALGILEHCDLAALAPTALDRDGGRPDVIGAHLVAEAELLETSCLRSRALIGTTRSVRPCWTNRTDRAK